MRALLVIGSIALAVATTAARAADYDYALNASRVAPIVIYDYEPGVTFRAYWLPPWHNHHYFPRGRTRAALHRYKHRIEPAQDFHREWSTSSGCGACAAGAQYPGLPAERQAGNVHDGRDNGDRVIHADADVTVFGPDRMDIRLFRKRGNESAE